MCACLVYPDTASELKPQPESKSCTAFTELDSAVSSMSAQVGDRLEYDGGLEYCGGAI